MEPVGHGHDGLFVIVVMTHEWVLQKGLPRRASDSECILRARLRLVRWGGAAPSEPAVSIRLVWGCRNRWPC